MTTIQRSALRACVSILALTTASARAADANDLNDIVVTATKVNTQTLITSSLATIEPQSIISRAVIENVVPPTADFNDVILLTPGASGTSNGNGPGLSESKATLRGFKDGNYNVTVDGVPFGDTNDPTHHSTSYFPNGTYERIIVDRGPGNASQLGQANFGGNINIQSRALTDEFGGRVEATYGSFNIQLYRGTLQTGLLGTSGIRAVVVAEHKRTDGALSNSPLRADNIFGKVEARIGETGVLSILASYNDNYFNQSDNNGATLAQVALYGKSFALSNPADPSYATNPYPQTRADYNFTHKQSDFEIIRLQVGLTDRLSFENKAYTYFYKNYTVSPTDITVLGSTLSASPLVGGVVTKVNGDIPGYTKLNQYRVYGDIMQANYDTGFGLLKVGGWLEFSKTHRYRYDYDLTRSTIKDGVLVNGVYNYDQKTTGQIGVDANGNAITGTLRELDGTPLPQYIQFDENSSWNQQQVFAEFEWKPIKGLTITPGVKFVNFTRDILSPIATQKARFGNQSTNTYRTTLPFATANYLIRDNWSVYAQYAKGFLIPALSNQEVSTANPLIPDPTKTTNYQAGTVYAADNLSLDADAYYIKLSNTIACTGPAGALCTNTGHPSTYKGLEGQASYAIGHLTLLANASVNESSDDVTGLRVAGAPTYTALAGALYNDGRLKLSFVQKFIGKQYADTAQAQPIDAYSTGIASAQYGIGPVAVRVSVYNVFNTSAITSISGGTQYFFVPRRSYEATASLKF